MKKAGVIWSASGDDVGEEGISESEDDSDVPAELPLEVAELFVSESEEEGFDGFA